MCARNVDAARLVARITSAACGLLVTSLLVTSSSPALAQQQRKKPAAPAAQTAAPAAPAEKQAALVYSPWTKFCVKGETAKAGQKNAEQVCFTGKDARLESGLPVVSAILIEPDKDPRKVLRVTLPLGMQLAHGTRIAIDQNQAATGSYVICFSNGCQADYDANAEMIGRLKKGRQLAIQAINSRGQAISVNLPLDDFAKAHDGPPADRKDVLDRLQQLQPAESR
jgi:invasion protein IalB